MERSNLLCISSPGHSFCFVIYFKCVFLRASLGLFGQFFVVVGVLFFFLLSSAFSVNVHVSVGMRFYWQLLFMHYYFCFVFTGHFTTSVY